MRYAILFLAEYVGVELETYIVNLGKEYSINFKVFRDLDSVNNSPILDVVSRGIPKEILYQMKNKRWYNDFALSRIVDNKEHTKWWLIARGFADYIPLTYSEDDIEFIKYPVIVKSVVGFGGSDVYLCRDKVGMLLQCKHMKINAIPYIVEEYVGTDTGLAEDYRVYIVNKECKVFIKRSNEGVTSNVSKGGTISIVEPIFEKELLQIHSALPLNVTAIDFTVTTDGKLKIFELNSSPGVKALYANGIDAYRPFLEWYSTYLESEV